MTEFRTRRDGRRYPISGKNTGPEINAMIKDKGRTFNERVIQESRKVEIKDPENMPGKKPQNETIVVQEKEVDVEIQAKDNKPSK
jgi:hypothetical protein